MNISFLIDPIQYLKENNSYILEKAQYSYYSSQISEPVFQQIISSDPTDSGKYEKWLISSYLKCIKLSKNRPDPRETFTQTHDRENAKKGLKYFGEDSGRLTQALSVFDAISRSPKVFKRALQIVNNCSPEEAEETYSDCKDINVWTDVNIFISSMDRFLENETLFPDRKKLDLESLLKDPSTQSSKLFSAEGWIAIVPETEEASCKYGGNTKWCTAGKHNNMFNFYTQKETKGKENKYFGPLLDLIGPERKFQLHFPTDQFMNEQDVPCSKSEVLLMPKSLLEFILEWRDKGGVPEGSVTVGSNSYTLIQEVYDNYDMYKSVYATWNELSPVDRGNPDRLFYDLPLYWNYLEKEEWTKEMNYQNTTDFFMDFADFDRTLPNGGKPIFYLGDDFDDEFLEYDYSDIYRNPSNSISDTPQFEENPEENPAWNPDEQDFSNGDRYPEANRAYGEGYSDDQLERAEETSRDETSSYYYDEYIRDVMNMRWQSFMNSKSREKAFEWAFLYVNYIQTCLKYDFERDFDGYISKKNMEDMLLNLLVQKFGNLPIQES